MNKAKAILMRFLTWQLLLGLAIGAASGYAYYYFVGCTSNTCAITSDPVNSTLYGLLIGGVLFFRDKEAKKKKQKDSSAH